MARRPQLTLESLQATKTPPPADKAPTRRHGQTLRLNTEAWKTLKRLAVEEEKTAHDLIIEAVNMLFIQRRQPPVA